MKIISLDLLKMSIFLRSQKWVAELVKNAKTTEVIKQAKTFGQKVSSYTDRLSARSGIRLTEDFAMQKGLNPNSGDSDIYTRRGHPLAVRLSRRSGCISACCQIKMSAILDMFSQERQTVYRQAAHFLTRRQTYVQALVLGVVKPTFKIKKIIGNVDSPGSYHAYHNNGMIKNHPVIELSSKRNFSPDYWNSVEMGTIISFICSFCEVVHHTGNKVYRGTTQRCFLRNI